MFDQISKYFTGKYSAFDQITKIIAQICYALVYNVNIDYASLILNQIASKISSAPGSTSKVYFHRFLQMVINTLVGTEAAALVYQNTKSFPSFSQQKRIFSDLTRSEKNKGSIPPLVYPSGMQNTLPSSLYPQYSLVVSLNQLQDPKLRVSQPPLPLSTNENLQHPNLKRSPLLLSQPLVSLKRHQL